MKNQFVQKHNGIAAIAMLSFFVMGQPEARAQSLAVNTTGATANASSILDVSSANKGILIPRVALTGTGDVTTIASPATSLLIYNTATVSNVTPGYYYWNGVAWIKVLSGTAWSLTGNSGTSSTTNFIGTTDNVPLVFRVNNQNAGMIDVSPNLFLGYQAGISNTGTENTGIGYQALNSNTTGGENTALGTYALGVNTNGTGNTASGAWALTFNSNGSFNSAFGNFALSHNSTGSNNSGFGVHALDGGPFVTGSDNTAAGYQAMKNATDGNKNAAFGTEALYFNASGSENTAIGYQSLFQNGSGNYNTATGSQAMKNASSGSFNVANGYYALYTSSGDYNTAIGFSAMGGSGSGSANTAVGGISLPLNTTGSENTAIGYHTLGENSTGSYNTALGRDALRSNHAGSYNVGLGYNALTLDNNDGNTAVGTNSGMNVGNATNCTFIGYQASGFSGLTNATAIGVNAIVSTSNSLVLGETGVNVGIGLSDPSNYLHVKGYGEAQVTIENPLYLTPGLLFKYAGNDGARIQYNASGGFMEIEDYYGGSWSNTGLVIKLGDVGIGTSAPTAKLSVNGTANNSTGNWGVFSDARVKTVEDEFTDGLNVIKQIRPVLFTYNENAPYHSNDIQVGVVAQELEKIAPYMVSQKKYGNFPNLREVNNQAYVFLLINAVKEQQTKIEELEKTIKELSLKIK